jgi:hypothetical protein
MMDLLVDIQGDAKGLPQYGGVFEMKPPNW